MTHYTVLVCLNDPEELDNILAPYDENKDVEPYRNYLGGSPIDFYEVEYLRKEGGLNPDNETLTWQQIADAYNSKCEREEAKIYLDEDGNPYEMTTYNPQSKWDWWTIGGRWGGSFPYKTYDDRLIFETPTEPDRCDGGPKGLLDLSRMRREASESAAARYDEFRTIIRGTSPPIPWSDFVRRIGDKEITIDQARQEYNGQESIQKLRKHEKFQFTTIDNFLISRDEYVQNAVKSSVPGYAMITLDGKWMAPGNMGWFGVSTDEEGDRQVYLKTANEYINSLGDEVYLVMVDCHI